MRWLHLSVIAIKTFMSSSNTFPVLLDVLLLVWNPIHHSALQIIVLAEHGEVMSAPQVKYQLPGKFGVSPRPPVIVWLWLMGWFMLITLPRSGIPRKLGTVVLDVGTHTPAEHEQYQRCVLRGFSRLPMCDRQSQRHVLLPETAAACLCVLGSQWRWQCDKEIQADLLDQWKPGDPHGEVSLSHYHLTWNKTYLVFWGCL